MNNRRLVLSVIAAAAFYPAASNAYPGKTSMDACVSAFEKTLQTEVPSRTYKVVFRNDRWAGSYLSQFFPTHYTFDLRANDPKTGAAIARARCSADSRGKVGRLSTLPATGSDTDLDSAF